MEDYIKRSDALNFDLEIECEPDDLQPMMEGMVRVMDYIKQLPAADVVEVVHGKWINAYPDVEPNPMFMYGICSQCGFEQSISDKLNYCPNCGAKMDGEEG